MDIDFISDTHGQHAQLELTGGDVLAHCGDFSVHGMAEEVLPFARWLGSQAYTHKVLIAGNHDFCMEEDGYTELEGIFKEYGIHYLNDCALNLDGIKVWGSPITPVNYYWAFQRKPGAAIRAHWSQIPANTDILITHGPPQGILDICEDPPLNVGCQDLRERVRYLKPRIHAFGHIHESYGRLNESGVQYINASVLNEHYQLVNSAQRIRLK